MNFIRRAWALRKDPIVADRSLDLACAALWFLYGMWGILSPFSAETILRQTLDWYPIVWGVIIGCTGLTAAFAVMAQFGVQLIKYEQRIAWKRVERSALVFMAMFIGVYPTLMFAGLFDGTPRFDLFFLSLGYLVFPIWRISHLKHRIANLRTLIARRDDERN